MLGDAIFALVIIDAIALYGIGKLAGGAYSRALKAELEAVKATADLQNLRAEVSRLLTCTTSLGTLTVKLAEKMGANTDGRV